MKNITIPKKLAPLVQAFSVDSEAAVKALIIEAAKMIHSGTEGYHWDRCEKMSNAELEAIVCLIKGITPVDTLEAIYAAQIVASHMFGMKKLSSSQSDDQNLGLKLLRFCNEAMEHLQKKRSGGMQNINVTYNYNGNGPALMQTVIPD